MLTSSGQVGGLGRWDEDGTNQCRPLPNEDIEGSMVDFTFSTPTIIFSVLGNVFYDVRTPGYTSETCQRPQEHVADTVTAIGNRANRRRYVLVMPELLVIWGLRSHILYCNSVELRLSRKRNRDTSLEPVSSPSAPQVRGQLLLNFRVLLLSGSISFP